MKTIKIFIAILTSLVCALINGQPTVLSYSEIPRDQLIKSASMNMEPYEHPDSSLFLLYNSASGICENNFKEHFTYDQNKNLVIRYVLNWNNALSQWYNLSKDAFAYDQNGKKISSLYSIWDIPSSQWIFEQKVIISNSDTLISYLNHRWNNADSSWSLVGKSDETYNDRKLPELLIIYYLNVSDSSWKSDYKGIYEYDTGGNKTLDSSMIWDEQLQDWAGIRKTEYIHDTNGKMIEMTFYNTDQFLNMVIPIFRYEFFYNESGDQNLSLYYQPGQESGEWILREKSETAYNDTLQQTMLYTLNGAEWEEKAQTDITFKDNFTLTESYNYIQGERIPVYKFYNYFPQITTQTGHIQDQVIGIYPNPATDHVKININGISSEASITLFDLQGKIVLQQQVLNDTPVSLLRINKGLYLCKVVAAKKVYISKLLVE